MAKKSSGKRKKSSASPAPKQANRSGKGAITSLMKRYAELRATGRGKTEAAVLAGYAANSASVTAARLEKHAWIKDRVKELQGIATSMVMKTAIGEQVAERQKDEERRENDESIAQVCADIQQRLMEVGLNDFRALAKWDKEGDVTFTASDDLTPGEAALVSGITKTVKEDGKLRTTEIKLTTNSSLTALRDLVKLLGLEAPKQHEHTGPDGKAIQHEHLGAHVHIYAPNNGRGPIDVGS